MSISFFKRLLLIVMIAATPLYADLSYSRIPKNKGTLTIMSDRSVEGFIRAPEFPATLDWINTDRPLSMAELKGKFVLLDFWTYCCINCLNIIPDLKKLEAKYPNELVIIGVHSAKFNTEKDSAAIANAARRYHIDHPIVNDHQFQIWSNYTVKAWPTTVLINPSGYIMTQRSGEGVFDAIDPILQDAIPHFIAKGQLTPSPQPPSKAISPATPLSFPTKIALDSTTKRLVVSDTNHHRLVVISQYGTVTNVIGSGQQGFKDGDFRKAEFSNPHGSVVVGTKIYVTDTGNHAIRVVDMIKKTVSTIAGTGLQAKEFNIPGTGNTVALNSPWDITYLRGKLYVAMAGAHQIWEIDPTSGATKPYAGSSREGLQDGDLPTSKLAQPSGITTDGNDLYFADSEVSGIRKIGVTDIRIVETLIGKGLFEFGDRDGTITSARLQHPLGVAHSGNLLYVADTYNHKIKEINLKTGTIRSIAGSGQSGTENGAVKTARFNEPSGLCILDKMIFVADTNNHAIRKINLTTGVVSTLKIEIPKTIPIPSQEGVARIQMSTQNISDGPTQLTFKFSFPNKLGLNDAAPNMIQLRGNPGAPIATAKDILKQWPNITIRPPHPMLVNDTMKVPGTWVFDVTLYGCTEDKKQCVVSRMEIEIPYEVTATGTARVTLPVVLR